MQQILESFKLYLKNDRGFSEETIVKYLGNLRILFKKMKIYDISQLKSIVINKRLLDDFWSDFAGGKKIASDSTRANYMATLKSFFKFCFLNEYITEDISQKIIMPKKAWLYLEGLNNNQQKILRDHIASNLKTEKDLRDAALIMFMWSTAARVSETLNLTCHPESYIYFHSESVISGNFHVSDNQVYAHLMGKGKQDRVIAVSNDALNYLNLYLSERKKKNEILFHNVKNNRSNTIKLSRCGACIIVENVLKKCNIEKPKDLRTHIFRHTAINTWLEMGYTKPEIIRITGHADTSGLDPYDRRNKRLTIPFSKEGRPVVDITDRKLKQIEDINKLRHSPQY